MKWEIAKTARAKKKLIKIAVVNEIGNAKKILEELKKNPKVYDTIKVMACFGGCIGGGGQPVPTNGRIRKERANSLYTIDAKKEIVQKLVIMMSWPQLQTVLAGGLITYLFLKSIKKTIN